MLRKITDGVKHIYLACGATDFRKQIPGLTVLIQSRFQIDPYTSASLFLFCNRCRTAIKALRYDANGFLLVVSAARYLVERLHTFSRKRQKNY